MQRAPTQPGDFVHQKPCPARFGPKQTGPLNAVGGAGAWQSIISATATGANGGAWFSNVDVYFDVPASWIDVEIRLICVTGGNSSIVTETTVAASGMEATGTAYRGIGLSGRGHPGSGWIVQARSPDLDLDEGSVTVEAWGHESTPEDVGPLPSIPTPDRRQVTRVSLLKGWDGDLWRPVLVDTSGRLIVNGGGGGGGMEFVIIPGATGVENIDPSLADGWRFEAVGDVVATATAPFIEGQAYFVVFEQDATGGRQFQFDGAITVLLPTGVSSLVPAQDAFWRSAWTFVAVDATTLELVSLTTAEMEAVVTYSVLGVPDYPLFLQGGINSAGVGLAVSQGAGFGLGSGDHGTQETGRFTLSGVDDTITRWGGLEAYAETDAGPNYTPTKWVQWTEIESQEWRLGAAADVILFADAATTQIRSAAGGVDVQAFNGFVQVTAGLSSSFSTTGAAADLTFGAGRSMFLSAVADAEIDVGAASEGRLEVGGSPRISWDVDATTIVLAKITFVDVANGGTATWDVENIAAGATINLPATSSARDGITIVIFADGGACTVSPNGGDVIKGSAVITDQTSQRFTWREADGAWYP